jgi:catechol 2,3-dioxygenase-like lactoylglutathione lyase family enzyme
MPDELVNVRYMVDDVENAVDFYTTHFGFTVRTNAAGNYSHTRLRRTLTWFQARTTVAARADVQGCAAPGPLPVQCVNATLSGFTARSAVSRFR